MSEQQGPAQPDKPADAWGQPISAKRQTELRRYLDQWAAETDHGERKGPFDAGPGNVGVELTGADVSWLAEESGRDALRSAPNLHLEGAYLSMADLGAAELRRAHLEGAYLRLTRMEGADLSGAHLQGAFLDAAHLEGAYLDAAHLERAHLMGTHLEGAKLNNAHLEGAILSEANLEDADLRNAWMDKATVLNAAALNCASLDQTTFENTNLSVVDWKRVPVLGDELTAQATKTRDGKRKSHEQRVTDYQAAVRAYRRLAVALQANGLSAESANYLYRAAIMERRLTRHERRVGAYFFSVLLAVLAGYGYRLGRIVVAYITVVAAFALAFLAARYFAGTLIDWEQVGEATQISLNAIHGRVFFAQLALDSVQAWIATVESVLGIVIEGVFVAMLIQRFFGR